MSDARTEDGQCPSWCDEHFDNLDTTFPEDRLRIHTGLKSTRVLSICGLWPLTTQLSRTDTPEGDVESYAIELHIRTGEDEIWLQLTPAEAEHLARQMDLLNAETRRVPASKQAGTPEPE